MTLSIEVFSQLDPDTERKRALAKVYSILLRLAEETKDKALSTNTLIIEVTEKESIPEPESVQLELMM